MRAISTVVDTTVFLLLLGGAVATLVAGTGAFQQTGENPADETARVVATTTTGVEYALTPTNNDSDGVDYDSVDGGFERTAHGSTAALLADATLSGATLDGQRLVPTSGGFERAVRGETVGIISQETRQTAITTRWEPYAGAAMNGSIHVGPEPPRTADVHATALTVDSGVPSVRGRAIEAASENGTDGVARVVAAAIVDGLFPLPETRASLHGDSPVDTLTAHRYRRVARLTRAGQIGVGEASPETMNRELVAALTERIAADMRQKFDTPNAAARAVSTGEVRIVVRTWSA